MDALEAYGNECSGEEDYCQKRDYFHHLAVSFRCRSDPKAIITVSHGYYGIDLV